MQRSTKISFVRHGNVYNPKQIIYGRLPGFGLSSKGQNDARRADFYLKNTLLAAIYCSPLLRTRQTAAVIQSSHSHLQVIQSSLLLEVKTFFEGQPESRLKVVAENVYHNKNSSFEQPADVLKRSLQFLATVRIHHFGNHIVAVTHGDIILFLTMWANKIAPTAENKLNLSNIQGIPEYPATGSVTTLSYSTNEPDELPQLHYFNTKKQS